MTCSRFLPFLILTLSACHPAAAVEISASPWPLSSQHAGRLNFFFQAEECAAYNPPPAPSDRWLNQEHKGETLTLFRHVQDVCYPATAVPTLLHYELASSQLQAKRIRLMACVFGILPPPASVPGTTCVVEREFYPLLTVFMSGFDAETRTFVSRGNALSGAGAKSQSHHRRDSAPSQPPSHTARTSD